jgi:signal transduction histidine kinase
MKIRTKVIFIICIISCSLTIVVAITANLVLLGQFESVQNSYVIDSTQRTGNILQSDIGNIKNACAFESIWDDTYRFVQGQDPTYMQDNFANYTLDNGFNCQIVLFINSSGQLYNYVSYDDSIQHQVPLPAGLVAEFTSHPGLWDFTNAQNYSEGVILLQGEMFLFSSTPILPSNGSGPVMGAYVMIKFLDSKEVQSLQQRAGLPVTLLSIDQAKEQPDFNDAFNSFLQGNQFYTKAVNSSTIFGYEAINDPFGSPALILRIQMPRDIWNSGVLAVDYYIVVVLASIILIVLAFFLFLEKTLLSRLSSLTLSVKDPAKIEGCVNSRNADGVCQICEVKGNDEISTLASSINGMLQEIGDKNNRLRHSEKMVTIGQMVTMIGHDLRNPLTGLQNSAYILKKRLGSNADEMTKQIFELMDYDVKYSNRIINDLLDYSRDTKLDFIKTSPNAIVGESLAMVPVPTNIIVVSEVQTDPKVALDRLSIKRAFINTIINAIEAMPNGGTLRISSRTVGDNIEFFFSDTGRGIDESTMKKLWTPFVTTKAKGMGLGLAIIKQVIDAHGGKISVSTEEGKGTTFTFTLPMKPSEGGGKQ